MPVQRHRPRELMSVQPHRPRELMRAMSVCVRGHRLAALTSVLVVASGAGAWAYFRSTGSASGAARVGTLAAPTLSTPSAGAGTAGLSWTAVTAPSGSGQASYYVTRDGGAAASGCGSASAPITSSTCTDSGLAAGQHSYRVTAVWHSWSASSGSQNVTLSSGAATQIVLSGSTANLASGATRVLTATIEDSAGRTVTTGPDSTASVTFARSSGPGTLGGLSGSAATAGVATDTVSGQIAGNVTVGASATLNGSAASSNALTFTVTPGNAASIAVLSGSGQAATVATAFAAPLVALVKDGAGNGVPGVTVTFTAPGSGPAATFPGGSSTAAQSTNASGNASVAPTANTTAGGYTVSAAATGAGSASFSLTNSPAAAATLSVGGFASPSSAGTSHSLTVTARDAYANIVTGYTGTVHFTSSDSQATLLGDYAFTTGAGSDNGTHTFNATLRTAGLQSITATDKSNGSITGSQAAINVTKANPTLTVGGPSTGTAGTAIAASAITAMLGSSSGANASGTVTFTVFGPQASAPTTCTSGGTSLGTASLSSSGSATPTSAFTPSQAGNYWLYASYAGDASNNTAASACPPGAQITVAKAAPTLTAGAPATAAAATTITAAAITATLGSSSGTNATGTIMFTVFGPQPTAPTNCASGGTPVGNASPAGNGAYHPSAGYSPPAAGTYWWYASMNGDANNNGATSACGSGMPSTVVNANATTISLTAQGSDTTNAPIAASAIAASLSGTTGSAGGTITFYVWGPQASPPSGCPAGGYAFASAGVSGSHAYNPSAGFTPTVAGTYWWSASYGGDANNNGSGSACGSGMASTAVTNPNPTSLSAAAPAMATAGTTISSSALSATLSGAAGGAGGTITFYVWGQAGPPSGCPAGGYAFATAAVSGNGTYHPSAGFYEGLPTTLWWYASYSGDASNAASGSACGGGMPTTAVLGNNTVSRTAPGSYTLAVPAHVTSFSFQLSGAGGGGSIANFPQPGGNGGSDSGTVSLPDSASPTQFTVVVGGGGGAGSTIGGAAGTSGAGCSAGGYGTWDRGNTSGGGGGGATCLYPAGQPAKLIVVAGGGGGGGGGYYQGYVANGGMGSGGPTSNPGQSLGSPGGSPSVLYYYYGGGGGNTSTSGGFPFAITSYGGGGGYNGSSQAYGGTGGVCSNGTCDPGGVGGGAGTFAGGGGAGGGGMASGGGGAGQSFSSGGGGGGSGYTGGAAGFPVSGIGASDGGGGAGGGGARNGADGSVSFTGIGISLG